MIDCDFFHVLCAIAFLFFFNFLSSFEWEGSLNSMLNVSYLASPSCIPATVDMKGIQSKWYSYHTYVRTYVRTYIHTMLSEKCCALQSLYSSQLDQREAEKRCVLRLDLNICRVLAGWPQGLESPWKSLKTNAPVSRTWKVLENGIGPWKFWNLM